jgi:hypothetical protein
MREGGLRQEKRGRSKKTKKGRQLPDSPSLIQSCESLTPASLLLQLSDFGECLPSKLTDHKEVGGAKALCLRPFSRLLVSIAVFDRRVVHSSVFGLVRPYRQFDATVLEFSDGAVSGLRVIVIGALRIALWHAFLHWLMKN